jgi:hypothetical protein
VVHGKFYWDATNHERVSAVKFFNNNVENLQEMESVWQVFNSHLFEMIPFFLND